MSTCKRLVGCQAAITSRLTPTKSRSAYGFCFSPLIRPSVSSPAALDLDPPAPFGRLSGGVHPGSGAQRRSTQSNTLHVGRREADRRAVSPDGYRSEGTPSLSEGPDAWGETFWFLLWRLTKGTRRKGETASCRYRRNGYVHLKEIGRLSGRHREQAHPHIRSVHIRRETDQSLKCPTIPFNSTPNCASSMLDAAFPRIANED